MTTPLSPGQKDVLGLRLLEESMNVAVVDLNAFPAAQKIVDEEKAVSYIDAGASLDIQSSTDKRTALHYAVVRNHMKILNAICAAASPEVLNIKDNFGHTALHRAIIHGKTNFAQILITEMGADVNIPFGDAPQSTPLIQAIRLDRYDIAALLLQAGAKLETTNLDGCDAAYYAAKESKKPRYTVLIEEEKKNRLMRTVTSCTTVQNSFKSLKQMKLRKPGAP